VRWSRGAWCEGGLDGPRGAERAQDLDCSDRRECEFGVDVVGDGREPQHAQLDRLVGVPDPLELGPGDVPRAEDERPPGDGVSDGRGTALELTADGGADEVGAVGVEALGDEEVDLPEVDEPHVDRDLLAAFDLGHATSLAPSSGMVKGWRTGFYRGPSTGRACVDGGGPRRRIREIRGRRRDGATP